MSDSTLNPIHIQITETFVRFHVLLAQILDRCLDETARQGLPEHDFQQHLEETHTQVAKLLSTNRVVKDKAEQEYERIKALAGNYKGAPGQEAQKQEMLKALDVLKIKSQALSDLLAVFRSL